MDNFQFCGLARAFTHALVVNWDVLLHTPEFVLLPTQQPLKACTGKANKNRNARARLTRVFVMGLTPLGDTPSFPDVRPGRARHVNSVKHTAPLYLSLMSWGGIGDVHV